MIYFIQCEKLRYIKIGYSNQNDVDRRLATLQVGCPDKLILIKTIDGGSNLERRLHKQFAQFKVRGEWFLPSDDLLYFILQQRKGNNKLTSKEQKWNQNWENQKYDEEELKDRVVRMRIKFGLGATR